MLWRTHIRIANEVLYKLEISKSNPEAASLREGIIAPDKWKDFPHHHNKEKEIEKHVMNARNACMHSSKNNLTVGVLLVCSYLNFNPTHPHFAN